MLWATLLSVENIIAVSGEEGIKTLTLKTIVHASASACACAQVVPSLHLSRLHLRTSNLVAAVIRLR